VWAGGSERAHAAGIVHRDLKPPNVFIARVDGVEVVKVLDFGIAKFLGVPREAQLQTQQGFVVGTPAYMSPEQVLGKCIDHRSDLWQLAIVAFECVTGKRPFGGETLGQLFMAICSTPLPVPSAVAMPGSTAIPPALAAFDAWFARAADRDPARRFGSAGEMAEALAAIFAPGGAGESAIPTIASSQRSAPVAPGATGRHDAWSTGRVEPRPTPIAFLAGLALAPLLLLSVGGLWWWRSRQSADVVALSPVTVSGAPAPVSAAPPPEEAAAATATATASEPAATASASAATPRPTSAPARPIKPIRPAKKVETDRIGL
jgi:serine/threonine-protein kinase